MNKIAFDLSIFIFEAKIDIFRKIYSFI